MIASILYRTRSAGGMALRGRQLPRKQRRNRGQSEHARIRRPSRTEPEGVADGAETDGRYRTDSEVHRVAHAQRAARMPHAADLCQERRIQAVPAGRTKA